MIIGIIGSIFGILQYLAKQGVSFLDIILRILIVEFPVTWHKVLEKNHIKFQALHKSTLVTVLTLYLISISLTKRFLVSPSPWSHIPQLREAIMMQMRKISFDCFTLHTIHLVRWGLKKVKEVINGFSIFDGVLKKCCKLKSQVMGKFGQFWRDHYNFWVWSFTDIEQFWVEIVNLKLFLHCKQDLSQKFPEILIFFSDVKNRTKWFILNFRLDLSHFSRPSN